jgi:hypothetical protein
MKSLGTQQQNPEEVPPVFFLCFHNWKAPTGRACLAALLFAGSIWVRLLSAGARRVRRVEGEGRRGGGTWIRQVRPQSRAKQAGVSQSVSQANLEPRARAGNK